MLADNPGMQKNGFTLVELLVVISLTAILTLISLPIYSNLQISTQLNETSAQLTQTIRTARERSLVRYNNAAHGVKFQTDRYTLYQGASFATRIAGLDREIILPNATTLATTIPTGEIVYTQNTGSPSATGTITITHVVNGTRIIVLNSVGLANEQ